MRIPLKDARRQTCHEAWVEGMSICSAPCRQSPHKVPDVQPDVQVRPSSKPGLQLALPLVYTAARIHIQQHRRSHPCLLVPAEQA
ncbi:hypothetical protein PDJAM_G00219460 [Pangasius djambal]|uniref:Uncharacterized protein n=1 Tax=Pangasius djambal TaxID=1691987 RepID=A0ACC5YC60_9TELE|nr:hypothetical protein [Pangasius djambal]